MVKMVAFCVRYRTRVEIAVTSNRRGRDVEYSWVCRVISEIGASFRTKQIDTSCEFEWRFRLESFAALLLFAFS